MDGRGFVTLVIRDSYLWSRLPVHRGHTVVRRRCLQVEMNIYGEINAHAHTYRYTHKNIQKNLLMLLKCLDSKYLYPCLSHRVYLLVHNPMDALTYTPAHVGG